MSETFIKIDSLQHLETSRLTYPTNWSKILANFSKLRRAIHISIVHFSVSEYCQCFTFKRCDKFKLKCTSHGGVNSAHYFGKISHSVKTVNVSQLHC